MSNKDICFSPGAGLEHAVKLLHQEYIEPKCLPEVFPNSGIGETNTLDLLAPHVLGRAARLEKVMHWHTWILQLLGLHGLPLFGMLG